MMHLGHQRADDIDQWSVNRLAVEVTELLAWVEHYKGDPT